MDMSTLSSIKSKLYEKSKTTLATWANGSAEVLSSLLGIQISWEYVYAPVFKHENSSAESFIWLPKRKTMALVSKSLHEIFNLNVKSKSDIIMGNYGITFNIQELQNLTISMKVNLIQNLNLWVSLGNKSSLTINLYPILYEETKEVWLDRFAITHTYIEKDAVFDQKINALYHHSNVKPKNLSEKETEDMLKLARKILPSLPETLLALINSTEIETLNYAKYSSNDMERISYAFFIPNESLHRQGLILNCGFSLELVHTT